MPQLVLPHREYVDHALLAEAHATALAIGARLKDAATLRAAMQAAPQQSAMPELLTWYPLSLAQGDTGLALVCATFARVLQNDEWYHLGHSHLSKAVQHIQSCRPAALSVTSLFGGLVGVAFATALLRGHSSRYTALLASLEVKIHSYGRVMVHKIREQHCGFEQHQYDLISGLTGLGTYLLTRSISHENQALLADVLACFVSLSEECDGVPNWYCEQVLFDKQQQPLYRGGYVNCGMAHGVPGMLALMALARLAGFGDASLDESLARGARWLVNHRVQGPWGMTWPSFYPVDPTESVSAPPPALHTGWCYGAPGIARSLWLVGKALANADLCQVADDAMAVVFATPQEQRGLVGPGLCHGQSGLLHITTCFAQDTCAQLYLNALPALLSELLARRDDHALLTYCDVEATGKRVDDPGFLNGAPGIALALLSLTTSTTLGWDRVLLVR
ncbi:MAG: lanthionine synthetase C family protein [Ktedonobacteraceae bacterium]|nr:lanthionine synthetase C family protein [Ktedonobacteraceae bacterium]MBA3822864.1 lanthionine synthetase C family protein [Ktedonobacterales bacterium]